MFKNLDAEQARLGLTDEQVAREIKISRSTYLGKKKTGKFNRDEITKLLVLFDVKFEYLFFQEDETA